VGAVRGKIGNALIKYLMKKLVLIVLVALASIAFTACQSTHTVCYAKKVGNHATR
jgi:hypothetical protein